MSAGCTVKAIPAVRKSSWRRGEAEARTSVTNVHCSGRLFSTCADCLFLDVKSENTLRLLKSKIAPYRYGRRIPPQLRDHCAYRPWKVDAGGPPARADRIAHCARNAGAGARLDGLGA